MLYIKIPWLIHFITEVFNFWHHSSMLPTHHPPPQAAINQFSFSICLEIPDKSEIIQYLLFLCLNYFTFRNALKSIHVFGNTKISFFVMAESWNVTLHIYIYIHVHIYIHTCIYGFHNKIKYYKPIYMKTLLTKVNTTNERPDTNH